MRLVGIEVDECPKFLSATPTENNHSIYCSKTETRIPLHLDGIISYIPTRLPDMDELIELEMIELTPMVDVWDPHDPIYSEQEYAMMDYKGEVKQPSNLNSARKFIASSVITNTLDPVTFDHAIADLVGDRNSQCISSVRHGTETCELYIDNQGDSKLSVVHMEHGDEADVDPKTIVKKWNVSLETAKRVSQATIRLCKRNTQDITLNRRFSPNDRMIRYPRVRAITFTDTLLASRRCISFRKYSCAQIFATEFGYIFACPLRKRADMEMAIKKFFKEVGVPPRLIADKAREQILGDTKKLCDQANCKIIELEKGTPASNRAERYIQIIKNETKKDLVNSDSPLVFW